MAAPLSMRKLQPTREEKTAFENVCDFEQRLDDIFDDQNRNMHYAKMGINPHNAQAVAVALPKYEELKE